ncbi:MAG: DNA primase [Proteobacteria bacterium]|nr:DNA primase [Pseudomonadota bacterium]
MIEESVIRTVIERTDIVRLIGEYVQLKRRGGRLIGLCPFHREKTPSFSVNAERGAFYCFGCHEGGSAVDFLMKLENLSFPEAIERLAERLGIEVVHTNGYAAEKRVTAKSRERSYLDAMKTAQDYFVSSFYLDIGSECRSYAAKRGITDAMVKSFELGYSPESWDGIVECLRKHGQSLEDSRELGLVASRDSGGFYARFRNRLMFPVHNVKGEIIAFGGRILDKSETAKYINSPESPIYTKGEHLYGLYQAKMHITREHCAILVEGNVDVVMMHAFGFCHTVASMGTALTPKQAALLYRHTKRVYLMYDGDNAGRKAMYRALGILLEPGFEGLYAVELPKDDDPDSYLRTYGAEGMSQLIENAKPLGMWCVQKKCTDIMALPPELRKSGFGELSELLHEFPDKLAQRHYLSEAARFLGQDERRLAVELGMNIQTEGAVSKVPAEQNIECNQYDKIEWDVVHLVLTSDKRFESFMELQGIELIQEPALRALLLEYAEVLDKSNSWDILNSLGENSRKLYEKVICSAPDVPEDELDKWYSGALAGLTRKWAAREHQQLGFSIAEAVKRNDMQSAAALIEKDRRFIEMMQQSSKERQYCWQHEG